MNPYDAPHVSASKIADYLDRLRVLANPPVPALGSASNVATTLSSDNLPQAYSSSSHCS